MLIDYIALLLANLNLSDSVSLLRNVGGAKEILSLSKEELSEDIGLGNVFIDRLKAPDLYLRAEKEMDFVSKFGIRALVYGEDDYPRMLEECDDAPLVLFVKGDVDFNAVPHKWVSVVGTRKMTPYGSAAAESIVRQLSENYPETVIVSGLAYGIDTVAHKAALSGNLPTVAVMAHGLKTIYPQPNRGLAAKIIEQGGAVVSEFPSFMEPYPHNFLQRNRIVAGLSDAVVIVESPMKGGSMSTAAVADSYNREIFAVPGRISDPNSAGPNYLIRNSKATLLSELSDMEYVMGWEKPVKKDSFPLFAQPLIGDEKTVYGMLQNCERSADDMIDESGMAVAAFYGAVSRLELAGLIRAVRGKMYVRIN